MSDRLRSAVQEACDEFSPRVLDLDGGVIIPDTDDELNWHAFLAHSLDMQGFRADWFVGRWPNPKWPRFQTLFARGIGIQEIGALWDVAEIARALLRPKESGLQTVEDVLALLEKHGGLTGVSLAQAFRDVQMRKNIRTVRAYLQNSHLLKRDRDSFRAYLARQVAELVGKDAPFPPDNVTRTVSWRGRTMSLEQALSACLEWDFYMVGPEIAPYMLCDWLLGLWRQGQIPWFESFKWDSRSEKFFAMYGQEIKGRDRFLAWCRAQQLQYPPRVVNEAIWLSLEPKRN